LNSNSSTTKTRIKIKISQLKRGHVGTSHSGFCSLSFSIDKNNLVYWFFLRYQFASTHIGNISKMNLQGEGDAPGWPSACPGHTVFSMVPCGMVSVGENVLFRKLHLFGSSFLIM
jgi:hypothetical protein